MAFNQVNPLAMISSVPLKNIISGILFGAALTAAGVYGPSTIIGQMQLTNFHMLKTFLAASMSSALITTCFASAKPRPASTLSLFSAYDGNIIGGLLLGFGMTLSGACPGTVLPQIATGVPTGLPVLFGAVLGGIVYSKWDLLKPLPPRTQRQPLKPTVYQRFEINRWLALGIYEGLCAGGIWALFRLQPSEDALKSSLVNPLAAGVLVGQCQIVSLLLTGSTLGISAAYEQVGDLFWWLSDSMTGKQPPMPTVKASVFALGTLLGSWWLSGTVERRLGPIDVVEIGMLRAIGGGVLLSVGSRMAGGCTSGHGISDMSMLSISSFVTVGAMFGGGVGLACLIC